MFRVSVDYFFTSNVTHVVHQDFRAKEVDQCLDGLCHLFGFNLFIIVFQQLSKVKIWISLLEAFDVKRVLEEYSYVCKFLFLAEVFPDIVSDFEDGINNLFLIKFVFLFVFIFSCQPVFVGSVVGSVV